MAGNLALDNQNRNLAVVKTALQGFHLSDVEGIVYAAVLNLGTRPAGRIAKHTGLNRSYTYDVLASLEKKGLLRESEKNKIKQYSCTSPDELLHALENREREVASQKESLKKSLPELNRLRLKQAPSTPLEPCRAFEEIAELFDDLESEEPMRGFTGKLERGSDSESKNIQSRFAKWREERGVNYRLIAASQSVASELGSDPTADVRVHETLDMQNDVIVYADRVALISGENEKRSVVMESPRLAESLREIHNALWKLLPTA